MRQSGLLTGVNKSVWHDYDPAWMNTNISGTPTMPDIGNGYKMGRYIKHPSGLVIATVQLLFGSTTTFGNGDATIIGLPIPGNRWSANISNQATADLPIGTALAWQGPAASPSLTMPLIPTLADPLAGINLQTNEDYFAHLFCQNTLSMGTGISIAGTATFTDVTHNLGIQPVASDIHVVSTGRTGVPANSRGFFIDNITTTQFRLNVAIAPGAGTAFLFDWKIRAEPNNSGGINLPQLVSYRRPWTWAANHGIFCQFVYEPR